MNDFQKDFWSDQQRKERRAPSHPVVTAFVKPKIDFVKRCIDLTPETTLLDVGCGNGFFTFHFAKICDVTGLDFSEVMLKINPHKKLIHGDANNLPFADNSFDVVFCSDLLHHLSLPEKALAEMKRVSRKHIVVSEPNRNNPPMFIFGLLKKEERGSLKFTKAYLTELFAGLNLEVKNSLTSGMIFPNKTPAFALPLLKIFNFNFFMGGYVTIIAEKS